LRLIAPNRFVMQWVKERFLSRISELAAESEGHPVPITLAITDSPGEAVPPAAAVSLPAILQPKPALAVEPPSGMTTPPALPRRHEQTSLNPGFTFATFVAGKANQLARAAGLQVAEHPTSYNPLFVYGGVGLGKTHLIQALGNHILQRDAAAKIRYIHAETYVSDVVRAYQHKAFDDFKRYYRSLDLLLIDDIQFFSGKNRTQEEFFYLFNTLIEAHKQVVITCDSGDPGIGAPHLRAAGGSVALSAGLVRRRARPLQPACRSAVAFFIAKHPFPSQLRRINRSSPTRASMATKSR
jgi:chromosomal replication initiator protein